MPDFRSLFRRDVSESRGIRVLAKNGGEVIGQLRDINHKGFRLATKQGFNPGAMLEGLIEFTAEGTLPRHIQITAQCVWSESAEKGFAIREIPLTDEGALDQLIEQASGKA